MSQRIAAARQAAIPMTVSAIPAAFCAGVALRALSLSRLEAVQDLLHQVLGPLELEREHAEADGTRSPSPGPGSGTSASPASTITNARIMKATR